MVKQLKCLQKLNQCQTEQAPHGMPVFGRNGRQAQSLVEIGPIDWKGLIEMPLVRLTPQSRKGDNLSLVNIGLAILFTSQSFDIDRGPSSLFSGKIHPLWNPNWLNMGIYERAYTGGETCET